MKRIAALLYFVTLSYYTFAGGIVRPQRQKYINDHSQDAVRDMIRTGVPASITLAQACLESQDGCSALAREANNHFGIKCSNWTGGTYIQDDDKKDECFRKYNSTLESYDDHSHFLTTRPRYAFLFQLDKTDYKAWAKGLKKAGYATDPNYADRLIKIIEDNELYLLDQQKEMPMLASVSSNEDEPIVYEARTKKVYVPSVVSVNAFEARKIESINGVEFIAAKKGESYSSIAKEMKLGSWQLPKYNESPNGKLLSEGEIVFIKPKKKEGSISSYVVKPGDTFESIAQSNGIKIKYLLKYNQLDENSKLEPGQQLSLKKKRS